MNPFIILAKRESLKIVLDTRYFNSLIDESYFNRRIEPIQTIRTIKWTLVYNSWHEQRV